MAAIAAPSETALYEIAAGLEAGTVVPYIGPGVWVLAETPPAHPTDALALVNRLTANASVPHKIRKNLSAAAQYIENFKHRKTLAKQMNAAFTTPASPTEIHTLLGRMHNLPLIVEAWYDDAMQHALVQNPSWGQVQGVSQAEHHGEWVRYYTAQGDLADSSAAQQWQTLLYRPLGSVSPAQNYIVSDSDYVEILTEIDIQTPIPEIVQQLRTGKPFLFIGCRFASQLDRIFARQIMKRSSDKHWAFIEGELTKNEEKFLGEMNITRLCLPPERLVEILGTHGLAG